VEVVPPPPGSREVFVWDPGHWRWSNGGYVWDPGHYVERRVRTAAWVPGHWAERGYNWAWIPGHWQE
jgi:hypothetical protein